MSKIQPTGINVTDCIAITLAVLKWFGLIDTSGWWIAAWFVVPLAIEIFIEYWVTE